jgi:RNA polymerase sigma-70 factor (ECF subfamily)
MSSYARPLDRLARAYELDPDKRRDLVQDIHLQLWRSFAQFDGRCSMRTWVYRVAHNVATRHVVRERRMKRSLATLEEIESMADKGQDEFASDQKEAIERLSALITQLKPLDRQIIVLYLEGVDAASTAEITGLSAANIGMKIHRIKKILKRWFKEGESNAG